MNHRHLIQVLLSFKDSNWKISQEKLDILTLEYEAELVEAASKLKPKAKKKTLDWAEKVLPPEVQDQERAYHRLLPQYELEDSKANSSTMPEDFPDPWGPGTPTR
jgi:hypothetical protein